MVTDKPSSRASSGAEGVCQAIAGCCDAGVHVAVEAVEKLEPSGLYKPADPTLDAMACGSGFDTQGSDSLTSGRVSKGSVDGRSDQAIDR